MFWRSASNTWGVECRWGRQKSQFSTNSWRIACYRSMIGGVRTTATVHRAVYRTHRNASVNLCLSQPSWTTTMNRTEQNLFIRGSKAEVTILITEDCARRTLLDYWDTDWASRGLSMTAVLIVYLISKQAVLCGIVVVIHLPLNWMTQWLWML